MTSSACPRVSAIMPTHDRPEFVQRAVEAFLAQDYPNKELVVIDTGTRKAKLPRGVAHVSAKRNHIIEKTAVGMEVASGDLFIDWEDDEYYGPRRISAQAEPIIHGRATVTGLAGQIAVWVPELRYTKPKGWKPGDRIPNNLPIHEGTRCFHRNVLRHFSAMQRRTVWKIAWVQLVESLGEPIEAILNDGHWIHVRHGENCSQLSQHRVEEIQAPAWVPPALVEFWKRVPKGKLPRR